MAYCHPFFIIRIASFFITLLAHLTKSHRMKFIPYITILLASLITANTLFSQKTDDLFMTKSIKKAVENKTRTLKGIPGINYWQNSTDYFIKVELIPDTRTLIGSEEITYVNNSPDTLKELWINLIQDLLKKGVARDWDLGKIDLHDGVNIKAISIDGKSIDINSKAISHTSTIMKIALKKYFSPKSSHKVKIEWTSVITGTRNVRNGTYNKTNFMVGYWFPKIAVYDDIYGWDKIPHKGNCEFYNEFGDFEVEITVPKDYIVWSSGILQNKEEVLNKKYIKRMEEAKQSDEIIHIVTQKDRDNGDIMVNGDKLTWKFKVKDMPDFAFSASKTYIWDGTSIQLKTKRVTVYTAYKSKSPDFSEVTEISRNTIDYYSNISPKIEFPYSQITIFNGGGGMEYPGMVNDGDMINRNNTLYVTSHEIGHSYFPFNTGLNEELYAWMDEGMISYLPSGFIAKYTNDSNYFPFKRFIEAYNNRAGTAFEIPLMIPSTNTGFAYRWQAYNRSSLAFSTLHDYLGEELFSKGLQKFTKRWKSKHPTPFDFFYTFNDVAGEDLGWFWKPWFYDLGYADLTIGEIQNNRVEIINNGGFPVAVKLVITTKDGEVHKYGAKANIWKGGVKRMWINISEKDIISFKLDTELIPDAFPEDNYLKK